MSAATLLDLLTFVAVLVAAGCLHIIWGLRL